MLPDCEVLRGLGAPVLEHLPLALKHNVHVVLVEDGARGQRFFGRDPPLDVLLEADFVELFARKVIGFSEGEWGGAEEVELVLNYAWRVLATFLYVCWEEAIARWEGHIVGVSKWV